MLTRTELTTARLFLQHAHASVLWVASLFFLDGNTGAAARLNDIAARPPREASLANLQGGAARQPQPTCADILKAIDRLTAAFEKLQATLTSQDKPRAEA